MNQWGNDGFSIIHNMMGPPGPNMGQPALLPTPMQPPGPPGPGGMGMPPLLPPSFLMSEWNQGNDGPGVTGGPTGPNGPGFIGPVAPTKPDCDSTIEDDGNQNVNEQSRKNKDPRDSRRDADRDNRGGDRNRRQRSPHRGNRDRNDRSRSDRRERRTGRWGDKEEPAVTMGAAQMAAMGQMGNNMMVTANNMMPYGNMMGQQPIDMANMPNMQHMQNMGNMQNMQNMNMIPGMNMMPNMMTNMMPNVMDQNMMMMQQMPMIQNPNQPIFVTNGVLLPPLPNASMPNRRERPPGCRTIFVGGLPHGISEDVIREIFARFGGIADVKQHRQGVCHVRFDSKDMVEQAFFISGFRFKRHDQVDNEATTLFIDYALNREDQSEHERHKRRRTPTPPRVEPYTPSAMSSIADKIKSDTEFSDAAPTLAVWLERGECNKKNANAFYSLIQAANNQVRRLYNEKMTIDEEFQTLKTTMRDKFAQVITQFEQVGKILTAAKMQRNTDHFSKQQRRNIDMWLKMTEDVANIKEEFNTMFDEEEIDEKGGKASIIMKKYEELKAENDNLQYELEGYKNVAHLAQDEAERKFEKFKAHFIAQQALQNNKPMGHQVFPPMPPAPPAPVESPAMKPPVPRDDPPSVAPSEAKLISVLTAFLLVHPLGASLDYLVSYVRSIIPIATQTSVHNVLQKYTDVFSRQMSGVGANIESKWTFVTYDRIKKEF